MIKNVLDRLRGKYSLIVGIPSLVGGMAWAYFLFSDPKNIPVFSVLGAGFFASLGLGLLWDYWNRKNEEH